MGLCTYEGRVQSPLGGKVTVPRPPPVGPVMALWLLHSSTWKSVSNLIVHLVLTVDDKKIPPTRALQKQYVRNIGMFVFIFYIRFLF